MTAFRRLIIAMAIAAGLSGGQTRAAAPTWKFGDVLAASNGFTIEGWTRNTSARQADLVIQSWSDPASHSIRAEILSNDDLQIVKLSAQASKTAPLPVIHAKLPWAAGTRADRIFSAAFGGSSYDWPKGFAHGNASTWPGYGYSPIAVFYESASGAGLGLTAFNDSLRASSTPIPRCDRAPTCSR